VVDAVVARAALATVVTVVMVVALLHVTILP